MWAISATTSDRNCDPLSDRINVGKFACLVMASTNIIRLFLLCYSALGMRIDNVKIHQSL